MKLSSDPDSKVIGIQIDSKNGAVTLTGRAADQRARDKAGKLAKKVKGVKSVENNITISST